MTHEVTDARVTEQMIQAGREASGYDQMAGFELAKIYLAMREHDAPADEAVGFRAKKTGDPNHDAIMEDLARRIDDE